MHEDAVRFALSISASQRGRLMKFLLKLRDSDFNEADFQEKDHTGRWLNVKVIRPFMITYWMDGPVNELRILDVEFVRD